MRKQRVMFEFSEDVSCFVGPRQNFLKGNLGARAWEMVMSNLSWNPPRRETNSLIFGEKMVAKPKATFLDPPKDVFWRPFNT